jgi:type I restriction enzyme S subunit
MLSDKVFRLRLREDLVEPAFLAFSLGSVPARAQIEQAISGAEGLANNLPQSAVRALSIPVPDLETQRRVARVLSDKTAEIDALIAQKESLLELLQLQRQTTIDVTVASTSGHREWQSVRLDRLITEVQHPVAVEPHREYVEIGVRSHGRGIFHKDPILGRDLDEKKVYWIEPGTLVFNIVFAWERAVAVAGTAEEGLIGSHRFPMFHPVSDAADVRYLRHFFVSEIGRYLLDQNSPGAAGRNRTLDRRALLKETIFVPPAVEQSRIADRLEAATSGIDAAAVALSQSLASLRQYRQALITAAVTGQLDIAAQEAA